MLRILYATDVHGSERCFMKLLNGGKLYKAHVIILGGDITGKMIVPIVRNQDGSYHTQFVGQDWNIRTQEQLNDLERSVINSGFYPYLTSQTEFDELVGDRSRMDELFKRLILERLKSWLRIAKERLQGTDIRLYVTGGNDDHLFIHPVLEEDGFVVNPEDKVVNIDEYHEMISLGYANMTPWKCPRDIPEEELTKKIDALANQVRDMSNCVFNFHVPPIDSEIDAAPQLDATTYPPKVIASSGSPLMIGAGSVAVRRAIETYQPLLGLHGHIHESRGFFKIRRTLCINPGSEYGEGILRAVIVNLEKDKVKGYQFVSG